MSCFWLKRNISITMIKFNGHFCTFFLIKSWWLRCCLLCTLKQCVLLHCELLSSFNNMQCRLSNAPSISSFLQFYQSRNWSFASNWTLIGAQALLMRFKISMSSWFPPPSFYLPPLELFIPFISSLLSVLPFSSVFLSSLLDSLAVPSPLRWAVFSGRRHMYSC